MIKQSAGILLYRLAKGSLEVFLVHPGGPFFVKKDLGVWSVPKGEFEDEEEALVAAKREFLEETGVAVDGKFIALRPVRLKSGKVVWAFALEHDIDAGNIKSNSFDMEWPPKSGKMRSYPEIDRGEWFDVPTAKQKIHPAQVPLIEELLMKLNS